MSMGKISKRPMSMARERTTLLRGEKAAKFSIGPTAPRPGPTLLRQVSAAVKDVVRSNPSKHTSRQPPPSNRKKRQKKTNTVFRVSSSTALPSSLTTLVALGWLRRLRERPAQRSMSRMREHLMPPAVLPAQPPRNMRPIKTSWDRTGHWAKSAVEKPEVETTDATWNQVSRMVWPAAS